MASFPEIYRNIFIRLPTLPFIPAVLIFSKCISHQMSHLKGSIDLEMMSNLIGIRWSNHCPQVLLVFMND